MNETWIQVLAIIGSNLVIMLTFFGVSVTLHIQNRNQIESIQCEIKDFHTRLALQDLEFKTRLSSIEERRNEKN